MRETNIGHFLFRRILDKLSPDILATFTGEQILALTQACDSLGTASHSIDIRVSVPLPYKPVYMVFLIGPERRSKARLAQDAQSHEAQGTYLANRILENVEPAVRKTLTAVQFQALCQACVGVRRKAHAIDLRVSIPFPGNGWYLVLWAGVERRSPARLRKLQRAFLVRAVTTFGVLLGCAVLGSILYAQKVTSPTISQKPVVHEQSSAHPTTVPFKHTRAECEVSGREWRDNQCFDYEHDPIF